LGVVTIPQFVRKQGQLRAALKAAIARLAPHFPNAAARATAAAYLQSLLSTVERKNSWQLAEAAGLANPYPFQHLLGRAQWDAEAVRDAHCRDLLAGLGQEDAVLAIDESGFIKKGDKSAGVARQYCGASGKLDNCQVGVFLSWQTAKGHALIDRVLYLPPGVDRRPGALRQGRHSRRSGLCDQARVGPPDARAGLGGRGQAGLGGGRRRLRGRQ
jgi:SRSO17 transposase